MPNPNPDPPQNNPGRWITEQAHYANREHVCQLFFALQAISDFQCSMQGIDKSCCK